MKRPCIKVGADPFPPYQYIDEEGRFKGIDFEKVKAVFDRAGYDIDVTIDDWTFVQKCLDKGELDAAFQVQPTPERLKNYFFSDVLREAATEVVTSNQDIKIENYQQIEQLNLRLGVISGYTNGPEIDALRQDVKFPFPNPHELMVAVSQGEVDLAVYDRGVKQYLMSEHNITNIYAIESMTFLRPLHVIFINKHLRDEFNVAMAELEAGG